MTPLLLILALSALQGPSPVETPAPETPAVEPAWEDFDGVALIVNDEIVTLRELNDLLKDARSAASGTTIEDANAMLADVAETTITVHLQTQAGRELGIPPEAVSETVERYLKDERRTKTAKETEDWMREQGAEDLGQVRKQITRELYRSFWIQGESGRGINWSRPYKDRYVRPGQLKEAYLINKGMLSDPTTYRLQFLVLPAAAWGDAETAKDALAGFRTDIEGGADMGALVEEYGAALRESRGISDWLPESRISDPDVAAFCAEAKEGALSPLLPLVNAEGQVEGYQLVRIVARIEGQAAPSFQDSKLQTQLETLIQERWDQARLTDGADRLWRNGFVRGPARLEIQPPWVRRQTQAARR
jgi:hypothetical protein